MSQSAEGRASARSDERSFNVQSSARPKNARGPARGGAPGSSSALRVGLGARPPPRFRARPSDPLGIKPKFHTSFKPETFRFHRVHRGSNPRHAGFTSFKPETFRFHRGPSGIEPKTRRFHQFRTGDLPPRSASAPGSASSASALGLGALPRLRPRRSASALGLGALPRSVGHRAAGDRSWRRDTAESGWDGQVCSVNRPRSIRSTLQPPRARRSSRRTDCHPSRRGDRSARVARGAPASGHRRDRRGSRRGEKRSRPRVFDPPIQNFVGFDVGGRARESGGCFVAGYDDAPRRVLERKGVIGVVGGG